MSEKNNQEIRIVRNGDMCDVDVSDGMNCKDAVEMLISTAAYVICECESDDVIARENAAFAAEILVKIVNEKRDERRG